MSPVGCLKLAHDIPAAGHLGQEKTLARVLALFFWPGVHQDVKDYCACLWPACGTSGGAESSPDLSASSGDSFKRVAKDLMGPLAKCLAGFRYILVVMDYATLFPEAIPLRNATAQIIA